MGGLRRIEVLALVGSPRKGGNSDILADEVLRGARDAGADVDKVYLDDCHIRPIGEVVDNSRLREDPRRDDDFPAILARFLAADVAVFATPVYWLGVSAQMKCFIDRLSSYFNRAPYAARLDGKGYLVVTTFGRSEPDHGRWVTEPLKVAVEVLRGRYLGDLAISVYEKGRVRQMPEAMKRAYELGAAAVRTMQAPVAVAEGPASGEGVRIAPMRLEDYDEVLSLWRSAEGAGVDVSESDSREGIARYLARNPGLSVVARDGGRIVGTILCGHDGRRGYLNKLVVAASHRRRGIGTVLVAHCLAALKREGIPRCNLFVYDANAAARRFWESLGWVRPDTWGVMHRESVEPPSRGQPHTGAR